MGTRIVFNGQEYPSAEAMPRPVREAYEQALAQLADTDRNRVPDVLERGAPGRIEVQHTVTINGKTYHSLDEMPADVRRTYEQAMAQVADGNSTAASPGRTNVGDAGGRYESTGASNAAHGASPSGGPVPPAVLIFALLGAGLATLLFWLWQQSS